MNRLDEIERFLEKFKELYKANPDFPILEDTFYSALATYGLTSEEIRDKNISSQNPEVLKMFKLWEASFKNSPNLDVYHTDRQPRFLQFRNCNVSECYKLYLSFPQNRMYSAVKDIFEYIANNNIQNTSKVADSLRSDAVVLRIVNKSDAIKVINYINNNKELYLYAKKTNPFIPRHGAVGYAYDNMLSYNSVVCHYLEKYFKYKREVNSLDSVSLNDFKGYLSEIYNNFHRYNFKNDIYIMREVKRLAMHDISIDDTLKNIKEVMELMIDNLENRSIQDYLSKVEEFQVGPDMYNVFEKACNATLQKYGTSQLEIALTKGKKGFFQCFTNDYNSRDNLIKYVDQTTFNIYADEMLNKLRVETGVYRR